MVAVSIEFWGGNVMATYRSCIRYNVLDVRLRVNGVRIISSIRRQFGMRVDKQGP